MTAPNSQARARPGRLGLYAPYIVLIVAVALVGLDWTWTRDRILMSLNAAKTPSAHRMWILDFNRARISGFPFRLDLDLDDVRLSEPSGWAISTPRLKAEAYLISPSHWVAIAPDNVTIYRRAAGPLKVSAKTLRATYSETAAHPPRISVEGIGLRFEAPSGARPYFLTSAREFHLHTRAGPNDQGAIYIGLNGGVPTAGSALDRIGGGPVTIVIDGIVSHSAEMTGPDASEGLKAWSRAGGAISLRELDLATGPAEIEAKSGVLGLSAEGRLTGRIKARATRSDLMLQGLASKDGRVHGGVSSAVQTPTADVPLSFNASHVALGDLSLGPAPRFF